VIDTTPTRRLVVAPVMGTIQRNPLVPVAHAVAFGATVGDIACTRDRVEVTASHGGQIMEPLVEDGDLASPGQPLVRLHPEGSA
jgi:[acyl-carrier-protein] S-malonyltransferase